MEETMPVVVSAMQPKVIEAQLVEEKSRREAINSFIKSSLKDGTDYGKIKIAGRDSKNCLFKAGAEKFCSLLQLRVEFTKDEDTLSMLQDSKNLVAYVCKLIHIPSGNVVSEGRGACAMTEKQNLANTTIKIAEKRAKIDAVLSLGLSDTFTQDLDDMHVDAPPAAPKATFQKSTYQKAPAPELSEADQKKKDLEVTKGMADKIKSEGGKKILAARMKASGKYTESEVMYATGIKPIENEVEPA